MEYPDWTEADVRNLRVRILRQQWNQATERSYEARQEFTRITKELQQRVDEARLIDLFCEKVYAEALAELDVTVQEEEVEIDNAPQP